MQRYAPPLPNAPPKRLALILILRSLLIRGLTSTRRAQGIGLCWTLLPALVKNTVSEKEIAKRMQRHVYRCEVDPDTAGLLVGALARREMRGLGKSTPRMKGNFAPLLLHLGRDAMERTLRPLLLGVAIVMLLAMQVDEVTTMAVITGLLVVQNSLTWSIRFAGIHWGWALEDKAALVFSRLAVRRWHEGLKWAGAAVAGLLFIAVLFLYNEGVELSISPAAGLGMLIALIGGRRLHPAPGYLAAWLIGLLTLVTGAGSM